MPNKWIEHVKEYASKNNVSYKEAMSKAKATYVKDIVNISPLKKVKIKIKKTPPLKKVRIKIKKAPPLPSKLPDDISPPPLPLSKPPKLKKSVKIKVIKKPLPTVTNIVKNIKKLKLKRAEMYFESKNPFSALGN
jgi:hypothetical protein